MELPREERRNMGDMFTMYKFQNGFNEVNTVFFKFRNDGSMKEHITGYLVRIKLKMLRNTFIVIELWIHGTE